MALNANKADFVYERLIDDIVHRRLRVDEPLVISRIAREYGVSEIPVREAIRRLDWEGFVQTSANHSATICEFDFLQFGELYRMRSVLEGWAARVCADYLTPRQLAAMREINERMAEAWSAGDVALYNQLNREFHMSSYMALPQQTLARHIDVLWRKWETVRDILQMNDDSLVYNGYQDHLAILALYEEPQRDHERIERLVRDHKFRSGSGFGFAIPAGLSTPVDAPLE